MDTARVLVSEDLELDGATVTATLHETGALRWSGVKAGSLVIQDDLLAYTKGTTYITLHTFMHEEVGCFWKDKRRTRKDMCLEIRTASSFKIWSEAIQRCMDLTERPKRLLVLLNPFGGKRLARSIFQKQVEPLLLAAGVGYTVKETQFQRHAKDLAKSMDLSRYDGVVCVSGDGVLVEVLNGLLERSDWAEAIKMPLGVIPAGTGNGMAKSLLDHGCEPCDAASAAFAIIRGNRQRLDVATLMQGEACFHSILLLTWGFVADIDIESEKLRGLGYLRNDIYTLIRILRLRKYNGSLAYVPAPGYEGSGRLVNGESVLYVKDSVNVSQDHDRIRHTSAYRGPFFAPEKNEWRTMDGSFVLVWLQNVPWASEDIKPAPAATFADGFLDMLLIKDCPWWVLLKLFLKVKEGRHVSSKHLEYLKVKAFRLNPGGRVGSKIQGGIIDLDGEVMARGFGAFGDGQSDPMKYGEGIQMTVEKGLATIFCPP